MPTVERTGADALPPHAATSIASMTTGRKRWSSRLRGLVFDIRFPPFAMGTWRVLGAAGRGDGRTRLASRGFRTTRIVR